MSGRVYYNELDPFCAQWLRNLVAAGLLPRGHVDERDIRDVQPDDLDGFVHAHWFAGLGGWPLAARMAGYPAGRELWTGSCPCQPFSVAGRGEGIADPRHLWPTWFRLIRERRPAVVMGEQVAAAAARGWLDAVCDDLEGISYAVGAAVLPAAAVDAPHRRDRLWFVADAGRPRLPLPECAQLPRAGRRLEGRAASGGRGWPAEPAVDRVAHGVPGRVGQLRALGNAIVPQLAAEVIAAFLDCHP